MLKLVSGHVHTHSPTGIATKTPSREMEEPLRSFDDMQASPKAAAQQESGSQTYSEGLPPNGSQTYSEGVPPNDCCDSAYALSPVEKRRKMNRESARRTRQRKQVQTVSLQAEVASLKTQNVCVNQQLKSIAGKNQELTAERQKLYEQNHTLMKCVAELSTVCKHKEATLEELRHCIQTADKLTDTPLPPVEQGQGQLSSQSIEMLCIPQLSIPNLAQPSSCRPEAKGAKPGHGHGVGKADHNPTLNMPAATSSHLLTPMQMHDSSSGYIPPRQQPLMTPLHTNSTFSRDPMMQSSARSTGMVSLPSAGNMPWVPTRGSGCNPNISAANSYASNSLPTSHHHLYNAAITSSNPTQQAGKPVHQRRTQPNPQRCVSGQACLGLSRFDFGGDARHRQDGAADTRQVLLDEAAKQRHKFNPKHVLDIVRMTGMPEVQRASSDPSFLRPPSRQAETMQGILGTARDPGNDFDWKADGVQQQSLEPSMVLSHGSHEAASTHGPQLAALECSQQALNISTPGFCQVPMQHLDASGRHNYSMQ